MQIYLRINAEKEEKTRSIVPSISLLNDILNSYFILDEEIRYNLRSSLDETIDPLIFFPRFFRYDCRKFFMLLTKCNKQLFPQFLL